MGKILILLDKLFGLRGLGLVLYGVLPSNLALLGALEIKIDDVDTVLNFTNKIPFLILAGAIPVALVYLLILSKQKDWYLTNDFLFLRSAFVTSIILSFSTVICGISLIIRRNIPLENLWPVFRSGFPENFTRPFLMAIVSLVVSSTFFMTILTKDINLPGIPSKDFVSALSGLRVSFKKLLGSEVFKKYIEINGNQINALVHKISDDLDELLVLAKRPWIVKHLAAIKEDLHELRGVLREIEIAEEKGGNGVIRWQRYFDESVSIPESVMRDRKEHFLKYKAVERIKNLKISQIHAAE